MFALKGIYTPIIVPFTPGGEAIDYDHFARNLEFWEASKLEGLVVMGSNGEFVALTEGEKEEVIRFTCAHARGKKKLIIGVGGNCIQETLHLCRRSAECGADAVLVVTPFYYKNAMKDAVLSAYFTQVADASPLPVVLYNMPGNTGVNTSSALLAQLSRHPNIVGVKDTSGNITQISETIRDADPSFSVFAGNWSFFLPSLHMGAKGATLALANILPNECCELLELFQKGDYEAARQRQLQLMEINSAVTARFGIGGLKAAMDLLGLYGGEPRSPLLRPNEEGVAQIREILLRAGAKVVG